MLNALPKPLALRLSMLMALLVAAGGCQVNTANSRTFWKTIDEGQPIVIAHRGDSGNFPEHTLVAYQSALNEGADFIEIDIVLTKDGAPICRHDLSLSKTTDASTHPRFSGRDGMASGFTLLELQSLRAVQPASTRPKAKLRLRVPTLRDAVDLTQRFNTLNESETGLYIEIKEPAKHRAMGLDPSKAVLEVLKDFEVFGDPPKVILQCFDRAEAERLAGMTDYPVVWLSKNPVNMNELPKGIAGLGLEKSMFNLVEDQEERGMRSRIVEAAHAKGLFVHVWTFRDDKLQGTGYDDAEEEMADYLRAGVDGVHTDFPETGVDAVNTVLADWRITPASMRMQKSYKGRTKQ